uniref:Uncharacterized protein n=1 Tax=Amphimedon queenslandica TaxID=400682 RepID=A0A1X7TW13_AMPQE
LASPDPQLRYTYYMVLVWPRPFRSFYYTAWSQCGGTIASCMKKIARAWREYSSFIIISYAYCVESWTKRMRACVTV